MKMIVFILSAAILTGCSYEITKKDSNANKTPEVETAKKNDAKPDNTKVEATDNKDNDVKVKDKDGTKIEINTGQSDREVKISKNGVTVDDEDDDDASNLVLDSVGSEKTYSCNNRAVVVNGAKNNFKLTGECKSLVVNGAGQTISVEKAGSIHVNGMNNKVSYHDGNPETSKVGVNNSIEKN